jgi:hypothetical protein
MYSQWHKHKVVCMLSVFDFSMLAGLHQAFHLQVHHQLKTGLCIGVVACCLQAG